MLQMCRKWLSIDPEGWLLYTRVHMNVLRIGMIGLLPDTVCPGLGPRSRMLKECFGHFHSYRKFQAMLETEHCLAAIAHDRLQSGDVRRQHSRRSVDSFEISRTAFFQNSWSCVCLSAYMWNRIDINLTTEQHQSSVAHSGGSQLAHRCTAKLLVYSLKSESKGTKRHCHHVPFSESSGSANTRQGDLQLKRSHNSSLMMAMSCS